MGRETHNDDAFLKHIMRELNERIKVYEVYKNNIHYIEAQVWDDNPKPNLCFKYYIVFL